MALWCLKERDGLLVCLPFDVCLIEPCSGSGARRRHLHSVRRNRFIPEISKDQENAIYLVVLPLEARRDSNPRLPPPVVPMATGFGRPSSRAACFSLALLASNQDSTHSKCAALPIELRAKNILLYERH